MIFKKDLQKMHSPQEAAKMCFIKPREYVRIKQDSEKKMGIILMTVEADFETTVGRRL